MQSPSKTLALLRSRRQSLDVRVTALLALAQSMVSRIEAATRSLSLSEAEREVEVAAAREYANERLDAAVSAASDARDNAAAAVETVLNPTEPPAGDDARALEQVRLLLERDLDPVQIVERARELRDPATLRALRWELRYFTPRGDFTDELQRSYEGLRDNINRTLMEVADGDESTAYAEAFKLQASVDAVVHAERVAVKTIIRVGGPTNDRLALAYAMNAVEHAADPVAADPSA